MFARQPVHRETTVRDERTVAPYARSLPADYERQDCQTERGTIRTQIAVLCAAIGLAHMWVGVRYASCSLQTGAATDAESAHCRGYLLSNVLRVLALSLPGGSQGFRMSYRPE